MWQFSPEVVDNITQPGSLSQPFWRLSVVKAATILPSRLQRPPLVEFTGPCARFFFFSQFLIRGYQPLHRQALMDVIHSSPTGLFNFFLNNFTGRLGGFHSNRSTYTIQTSAAQTDSGNSPPAISRPTGASSANASIKTTHTCLSKMFPRVFGRRQLFTF